MRIRRILISIIVAILLSSCDDFTKYKGAYPELHSIATHSILGVFGHDSDEVLIITEDEQGRVLFAYAGASINSENHILAILVAQKTTETDTYFYDTFNFIVKECPKYIENQKLTEDFINQYFSQDEIDQLKIHNDWNLPIRNDLLFKIKITNKKTDTISSNKQEEAFKTVSDKFKSNFSVLLSTDSAGLSLYIMRESTYNKEKDELLYGNTYMLMFDKVGILVSGKSVEPLNNLWNYQDQLRTFKERNGWSFLDD